MTGLVTVLISVSFSELSVFSRFMTSGVCPEPLSGAALGVDT